MEPYDFSVIVPALQEERTIGKSLSSIDIARRRSGHNVEIILVDGGSSDRTVEVAGRFADKTLVHEERGIGKARNVGAMHARGETLVFLDADVRVPENFFSDIYSRFMTSNLAGASCRVMPHPEVCPSGFERGFYTVWHNLRRIFYNIRPCGTGDNGIIVRRGIFEKVRGFDESLPVIEDLDFVFRASMHGRFEYLKDLTIHETIRRFRDMGTPRFVMIYLSNFFHYLIRRSSRVRRWDPVR